MSEKYVDEYLTWRVNWLERRYWSLTKTVRLSMIATFLPLIALLAAVLLGYGREEPFTQMRILVYAGIGLFVAVGLTVHGQARNHRRDVEEELALLYTLPPTRPYLPPTFDQSPGGIEAGEGSVAGAMPPR